MNCASCLVAETMVVNYSNLLRTRTLNFSSSTEEGSENFDEFLSVIGEKIRLKGWERYRGGLDVKGNYYY